MSCEVPRSAAGVSSDTAMTYPVGNAECHHSVREIKQSVNLSKMITSAYKKEPMNTNQDRGNWKIY
jgi:hypothetical protein